MILAGVALAGLFLVSQSAYIVDESEQLSLIHISEPTRPY